MYLGILLFLGTISFHSEKSGNGFPMNEYIGSISVFLVLVISVSHWIKKLILLVFAGVITK